MLKRGKRGQREADESEAKHTLDTQCSIFLLRFVKDALRRLSVSELGL